MSQTHSHASAAAGDRKTDFTAAFASIIAISSIGVAIGLSFPLLSLILEQRGYSAIIIGANAASAGVAAMAAVWLVNPMVNRLGVINTMLACAVIASACMIGFHLFDQLAAWFALRIVFSGALTLSFVLSEFWINSAASERQRGLMLGIYATVLSIGFGIGPGILALTGSGGALPFAIGAAIILVSCLPVLFARRREPVLGDSLGSSSGFLKYVLIVPLATGAVAVFGAVEQSILAIVPVYGQRLGYTETGTAVLLMVFAAGNVGLQIPLGIASDRVKDRRVILYLCGIIGVAGALLLPVVINPTAPVWPAWTVLFVWGGVISGLYTVGLAHLGSRLSGGDLAQANAAFVFCYTIGMILGPQLSGIAMEAVPPHGFAWCVAAFFAAYLLLCIVRAFYRQRKPAAV
ncbi:MAG: MFS transporter [Phyllobacteriaceae bacterium]|nr:MFS transporter [Phyllobacteriaceae bacterium]